MRVPRLRDALILIAATAASFVWLRYELLELQDYDPSLALTKRLSFVVLDAQHVVPACLGWWTLAVFVLGLLPPRRRFRRLARSPGWMASSAASLAIVLGFVWLLVVGKIQPFAIREGNVFVGFQNEISFAVIGAWLAMATSGRWRAEKGWIDRAGRALGLAWMATACSQVLYYALA